MSITTNDFEKLSVELSLEPFDIMVVGDGSGTVLTEPCGWAYFAYHKQSGKVTRHFGCASGGTNNYAELTPYLHTLWFFESAWEKHGGRPARVKVAIVSDSEVTVKCGRGEYGRSANASLWAQIDWFAKRYDIQWRHVRRNSNPISKECDRIAGLARKKVMEVA